MIGSLLQNRYRLDAEVGRGGMGVVYRAHDTLLDREVAVKVLSSAGLGTHGRARLLREAQSAARLNHPHIVSVHDAGESDGSPFIVMELVEGQSLRHVQPGSLSETLAIVSQMCGALEHAHAHGIIHRDLKLENVLIVNEPQSELSPARSESAPGVKAKLMDFGLARTADTQRLTEESALIGTVFYVAPEIVQGQPASAQSDLYALGVMLYELTTGQPPFSGDNLMAVISQHLHAPVVPPSTFNPKISPALDALVIRLLAKRPDDRPSSAAEVRRTLEHLDAPAPVMPATILPLFHARNHILVKPWVRRYPVSPLHAAYWKYVIIEPQWPRFFAAPSLRSGLRLRMTDACHPERSGAHVAITHAPSHARRVWRSSGRDSSLRSE